MTKDAQNEGGQSGMPISRRSFLRGAAYAASAAILAACGGGGNAGGGANTNAGEATNSGSANTSTGDNTNTSAPAQASGDQIVITQWYHQYGEEGTQQAAQRYADAYTKENPKVKVNMVWVAGDYDSKLSAALLTDEAPDVYEHALNLDFINAGQVTPLDDLFTPDVKSDFTQQDLDAYTVDGKIYGVKMIDDTGLLYYKKSLLDKAGVKPPTTLDELGAAIKALSSGRVKGMFMGNDGGVGVLSSNILWSAGHEHLKNGQVDFNNDDVVAAFQKAQQFVKAAGDGILVGAPTDWWDPSAFTQGLVAMQWTGLWAMPAIKKALGDDFGIVAWPAIDSGKGKPATFWGGWGEMVNGKSKHIDEAKAFVKWLWIDKKEFQKDWALSYGFHVPPRKSVAAEAEPLKSGPPADAVKILYDDGHIDPPQWTGAMGTAYSDAVTNMLKNSADPKTELANAAQKVQAELARQKS
ncbi:MAG TPA: extracellular solute-binding protein [Roseiflexaceae bacterium]|jgi:multiple sugar transport system substrate-binding protein|nr:extracellular solute-binding protein [Roseiflexaceae bacterium]